MGKQCIAKQKMIEITWPSRIGDTVIFTKHMERIYFCQECGQRAQLIRCSKNTKYKGGKDPISKEKREPILEKSILKDDKVYFMNG